MFYVCYKIIQNTILIITLYITVPEPFAFCFKIDCNGFSSTYTYLLLCI